GTQVGRLARGHADLVEVDDAPAQIRGNGRDLIARALLLDGGEEAGRAGLEGGALRPRGQGGDHGADPGRELHLLLVLALVEDLAVRDRARIVEAQVVERVQDRSERVRLVGAGRGGGEAGRQDEDGGGGGEGGRQR